MTQIDLNRREFLKGCGTVAVACAASPTLVFSPAALAAANGYDTIVLVFLRGGMDGLNLVVPTSGNDRTFYEQARPNLSIATSGAYGALPLTLSNGASTAFGLHPSATGLRDIWTDGKLAIVQSCGMPTTVTRSHFNAQSYLDFGTPGRNSGIGWITRALNAQSGGFGANQIPALAASDHLPSNLLGSTQGLVMTNPKDFALNTGAWQWQTWRDGMPAGTKGVNETLVDLWKGKTGLETSGADANSALRLVNAQPYGSSVPSGWPSGDFANQLWTIAQSIRFNLGLRYATLDLGSWDTHDGQGTAGSGYNYYQDMIATLSQGLSAFYGELKKGGELGRVTVIVQSEFGRRVRENGSRGTDHGYGNPLFVFGGPINGRRFYGKWAGLDPEILSPYFGDVPASTDFRAVFSELLSKRMGITDSGVVFPDYVAPAALGIVQSTSFAAEVAKPSPPAPGNIVLPPTRHRGEGWLLRLWSRLLRFLLLGQ